MSSQPAPLAEARPSATVLIVRDGKAGLEVFMVARDRQVDFASGAVVFPGGKIDPDDHAPAWNAIKAPGAPDKSYWIAAIRETFEESGLLIASHSDGRTVESAKARATFEKFRTPLLDGKLPFSDLMQQSDLTPALDLMTPFAHWITPVNVPKRFDTHFFLLSALPGQDATPDMREAVKGFWHTPDELLSQADSGAFTLVPATRWNIVLLGESNTVAEAFAAARARKVLPVMPKMEKADGGVNLSIRTDAGYKNCEVFMRR